MYCKVGNTYSYDKYLESIQCDAGINTGIITLRTPISGQILTLQSGVNAWTSNQEINQIIPITGDNWRMESGANLYTYAFGLTPIKISGSGLPSGLGLKSFNTITGIPTVTGSYTCNLKYTYSGIYCNKLYTGIDRKITITVCTGINGDPIVYNKIFSKNLGPKFSYDADIEYGKKCFSGVPFLTVPSGQRLTLQSGVETWKYTQFDTDYTFITGNRLFTLSTGTNLFNTSFGIVPIIISGNLPATLGFKDYCTITGVPNETGKWTCYFRYGYCGGNGMSDTDLGKINNLTIEVIPASEVVPTDGVIYLAFSPLNTVPYNLVKVKNVNFYYNQNNRFTKYFDQVTGYGNTIINIVSGSGSPLFFGNIDRPTGYLPAVTYKTGSLYGTIYEDDNSSSYTWSNVLLTSTGEPNKVYLDYITGYKQAVNSIKFNTGLLVDGDILSINDINFYYRTSSNTLNSNYEFTNLEYLTNILNSGATGGLLDPILQFTIGVTGYVNIDNSSITLFSYYRTGEDGNSIKIARNTENVNSIQISSRYFQSGETFRPSTNTWYGDFSTLYNTLTKENSGIYFYNYQNNSYYGQITGIVWDDTFSGNYYVTTGLFNIQNFADYSGSLVLFVPSQNRYSGSGVMPSGQNSIPSGFSISIRKPNYYNISGNIAKYTLKGVNFTYSGLIEG